MSLKTKSCRVMLLEILGGKEIPALGRETLAAQHQGEIWFNGAYLDPVHTRRCLLASALWPSDLPPSFLPPPPFLLRSGLCSCTRIIHHLPLPLCSQPWPPLAPTPGPQLLLQAMGLHSSRLFTLLQPHHPCLGCGDRGVSAERTDSNSYRSALLVS